MRYGPNLAVLERAKKRGKTVKALDERPNPPHYLNVVLDMFLDLSAARPSGGMGPSSVLLTEMSKFLDEYDIIDKEERRWYLRLWMTLDRVFLRLASELSKTES